MKDEFFENKLKIKFLHYRNFRDKILKIFPMLISTSNFMCSKKNRVLCSFSQHVKCLSLPGR